MAKPFESYCREKSYQRLESFLDSIDHNPKLSLESIKREFEAKRQQPTFRQGFCLAPGKVLAIVGNIPAELIQNTKQGNFHSIKDWFDQTFTYSQIFSPQSFKSAINYFQTDKNTSFCSINGRIYLYQSEQSIYPYLLAAIISQKASTTAQEAKESKKQFTLPLQRVHFEHPQELITAFDNFVSSIDSHVPNSVKNYILSSFNSKLKELTQTDYLDYNPQTNTYDLHLLSKVIPNLTAQQAIDAINKQQHLPEGIKVCKHDTEYYVSAKNIIYRTSNENELQDIVDNILTYYTDDQPPFTEDYLIVKDMYRNDYEIQISQQKYTVDGKSQTPENIHNFKQFLLKHFEALKDRMTEEEIPPLAEALNSTDHTFINLPSFELTGITEEQIDEFEEIIIKALKLLYPQQEQEYEQGEDE